MLVKILGGIDVLASLVLLALSFGLGVPEKIIIVFALLLFLKGLFILTKSIASAFDLIAFIVLITTLFVILPQWIYLITAFLILQKGIFSFL